MSEYARRIIFGSLVAFIVAVSIGAGILYLSPNLNSNRVSNTTSSSSAPSFPIKSAESTNTTIGLKFLLSVNTTVINPGQAINITFSIYNILTTQNNVSEADNWAFPTLDNISSSWYPCPYYASFQIIQGYFTMSNISLAKNALQLSPPGLELPCFAFQRSYYVFQPQSNQALFANGPVLPMGGSSSINGTHVPPINVKTLSSPTMPLGAGVYTIAAGDEWGQLVILHFQVNNATTST